MSGTCEYSCVGSVVFFFFFLRISFYWASGLDKKSLKIREGAHGLSLAAENKPPPLPVMSMTDRPG